MLHRTNMGERVLFLDDFISDGDTEKRVIDAVSEMDSFAKVVATYLYSPHVLRTPKGGEDSDRRFGRCFHEKNGRTKVGTCRYCNPLFGDERN
jgi:hypothetical protein